MYVCQIKEVFEYVAKEKLDLFVKYDRSCSGGFFLLLLKKDLEGTGWLYSDT